MEPQNTNKPENTEQQNPESQSPAPSQPQEPNPNPEQKTTKGYGKRPMWQWVVIYLVVAVVLYGLIYLLFFSGGTTPSY